MAAKASIDKTPFEAFLIHEAQLLDERRFRDWMELFTDDGTYWVPAVSNQDSPFNQASLFYDDRELMKTRIDRLEHPRIHIQTPPSRTAHIVGNITVAGGDAAPPHSPKGDFVVTSTFMMVEYRDEQSRVFAGRQHHVLRILLGAPGQAPTRPGDGFKIAHKKVELINCDSAFEAMALPI